MIILVIITIIIMNTQNKLHTIQFFSLPDDQFAAQKSSDFQPREDANSWKTKKSYSFLP